VPIVMKIGLAIWMTANPLSYITITKGVYLYQRTQSLSRFIIIWYEKKMKKALLSWCITTQRIWL
jgi:hypothetical protein